VGSALPSLRQFSYNVVTRMKVSSSVRLQKPFPLAPPAGAKELFSPLTACIVAVAVAAGVIAIYSPALEFPICPGRSPLRWRSPPAVTRPCLGVLH